MAVNGNAFFLNGRVALKTIASKLAPTGSFLLFVYFLQALRYQRTKLE
ncbi:hypothetical protein PS928_02607 [Pseudomonas fluorescens]|uniref:Uncharacterized protein n=1 Tax=Pseudomonas fluorescens TaxID=294 RepID=A0A5E7TSL4_PSEFL|nr:hypothetical protein PS928_02607 [Pseudomonas fluorescens]